MAAISVQPMRLRQNSLVVAAGDETVSNDDDNVDNDDGASSSSFVLVPRAEYDAVLNGTPMPATRHSDKTIGNDDDDDDAEAAAFSATAALGGLAPRRAAIGRLAVRGRWLCAGGAVALSTVDAALLVTVGSVCDALAVFARRQQSSVSPILFVATLTLVVAHAGVYTRDAAHVAYTGRVHQQRGQCCWSLFSWRSPPKQRPEQRVAELVAVGRFQRRAGSVLVAIAVAFGLIAFGATAGARSVGDRADAHLSAALSGLFVVACVGAVLAAVLAAAHCVLAVTLQRRRRWRRRRNLDVGGSLHSAGEHLTVVDGAMSADIAPSTERRARAASLVHATPLPTTRGAVAAAVSSSRDAAAAFIQEKYHGGRSGRTRSDSVAANTDDDGGGGGSGVIPEFVRMASSTSLPLELSSAETSPRSETLVLATPTSAPPLPPPRSSLQLQSKMRRTSDDQSGGSAAARSGSKSDDSDAPMATRTAYRRAQHATAARARRSAADASNAAGDSSSSSSEELLDTRLTSPNLRRRFAAPGSGGGAAMQPQ